MVSCKKNLLLRFDNFEEGAELTTVSSVSYSVATLTRYVRVSASVAFHEFKVLFKWTVFFQEWSFWWLTKVWLTGNSFNFFFPILKQRVHLILREWENSHLQSRTSQLGSYTCCESHRNVRVLNLFACPCLVHDVQICPSEDKDPIVVVKREEGSKNKATRRTNQ